MCKLVRFDELGNNGHLSSESCRNSIFGTGVEFCADPPPGGVIMHIRQTLVSLRVLFGLLVLLVLSEAFHCVSQSHR